MGKYDIKRGFWCDHDNALADRILAILQQMNWPARKVVKDGRITVMVLAGDREFLELNSKVMAALNA